MIEAAWQAICSNPHWRAEYDRLCHNKHSNQAVAAIARKLLVTLWYVLSEKQAYKHSSEEDLAYKMVSWAWYIDKKALNWMSRHQFSKYGLIHLGKGKHLTRIVRSGRPRRIASLENVLVFKSELKLPQ